MRGDAVRSHGLTREAALFIVFGGVQLVVDWATFVLLTWAGASTVAGNVSGRIVGAVLGYWLNGRYTFRARPADRRAHGAQVLRFLIGWAVTALVSTAAVYLIERHLGLRAAWAGKLAVDAVIAALGFALSKYWIFR